MISEIKVLLSVSKLLRTQRTVARYPQTSGCAGPQQVCACLVSGFVLVWIVVVSCCEGNCFIWMSENVWNVTNAGIVKKNKVYVEDDCLLVSWLCNVGSLFIRRNSRVEMDNFLKQHVTRFHTSEHFHFLVCTSHLTELTNQKLGLQLRHQI